ncbi:hypothetical protein PS893_03116 [Pseudomonas fluorescens]|jgi:hypothetical protein|uniref:hypothetical protein n=1 Tax=Pseudomonas TaxID=286 RepID=UPI001257B9AB|nr:MULTISPECIES: hypothetical protein [Pseudomonas]QHF37258.1 hypothetical protein PspS34_02935 [Pseudomonas sp. S34]VVP06914.1 hypothetical protein PS893_03116 [Pseudomonas fluorescens]
MEVVEGFITHKQCTEIGKARLARSKALLNSVPRAKALMSTTSSSSLKALGDSSPTRELDALVLGNTLIGYGDNISLENMTIIENLIKFSKLEADRETKESHSPAAWHRAFLQCMEDMGCSVPINASIEYKKRSGSGTMRNVVSTIIQAGVEAVKAAIPGATVLSAVADSTLSALEKEPETIKVFNYEVTKAKGVKLALLPCEQTKSGLVMVSFSSVNHVGDQVGGGVLFLDLKIASLDIYQGSNFLVFNPSAYAEVKDDVEFILAQNRKEVLAKRFVRRRQ